MEENSNLTHWWKKIPFVFWRFPICCSRVLGLFSWKIWHFFKCHTITQFCFSQCSWNFNTTLGLTEESSLLICHSRVMVIYLWKIWHFFKFCAITQLCTNTFSWNFITEQELIKVRSLSIFMIFIFVIPELWYFIHENRLSFNTSYNNSNLL